MGLRVGVGLEGWVWGLGVVRRAMTDPNYLPLLAMAECAKRLLLLIPVLALVLHVKRVLAQVHLEPNPSSPRPDLTATPYH